MDRKRAVELRSLLTHAKTGEELRKHFIELAKILRALPESQRPEPAPPVLIRVFNAGRDRLPKVAPDLAASLTAPPAADRTCALGVVLARCMELAVKLGYPPAPPPVAAKPAKKALPKRPKK